MGKQFITERKKIWFVECNFIQMEVNLGHIFIMSYPITEELKDDSMPLCRNNENMYPQMQFHLKKSKSELNCRSKENREYLGLKQYRPFFYNSVICPDCSHVSISSEMLEMHVSICHSRDIIYNCKICNFKCKWNYSYYVHMKTHFPGPPFHCGKCLYICDQIEVLLKHLVKHVGEPSPKHGEAKPHRPIKEIPDRHEHSKEKINIHTNSYRNKKAFPCDICGFSAEYKSTLRYHMKIHSGKVLGYQFPNYTYFAFNKSELGSDPEGQRIERLHTCPSCGKDFKSKSHLVRHERIHLVDKPFRCEYCAYTSSRKDKLKEHFRKYHGSDATSKRPGTSNKRKRRRSGVQTEF